MSPFLLFGILSSYTSDSFLFLSFVVLQNGAGHKYSRSYGFGVLNAEDLINAAKEWEHVDTQQKYTLRGLLTPDTATLRSKGEVELKVKVLFNHSVN